MAFAYKLEHKDGTLADPPTVRTAAPTAPGDTIPLGRDKTLRVIGKRPARGPDEDPCLWSKACRRGRPGSRLLSQT
jgi:hypothetical protein